jgi:1-aminocyclopropane-1-carboxylate deaminase
MKLYNFINHPPSPLTHINLPFLKKHGVSLALKRDDLIHPCLSGNKWRKLKYSILQQPPGSTMISFGGCFSNHLYALAGAGKLFNYKTVGIIRGEDDPNNPTLQFLKSQGMVCHFVSRQDYRQRANAAYQEFWRTQYPNAILIPEGGAGMPALEGVFEIVSELNHQVEYDVLCCAVGSGTTLAGLAIANQNTKSLIGVSALKGGSSLEVQINKLQLESQQKVFNYCLESEFHFGGFGRITPELATFTREFVEATGVVIEPIYTGKMLLGIQRMVESGRFKAGTKIVALHTGGLQGLNGLAYRELFHLSC